MLLLLRFVLISYSIFLPSGSGCRAENLQSLFCVWLGNEEIDLAEIRAGRGQAIEKADTFVPQKRWDAGRFKFRPEYLGRQHSGDSCHYG